MKTTVKLAQICLLTLPALANAQFTFTTNSDGSLNIYQYTGSGGTVTIPDATNGLPITSIGTNAFENATFSSVTIPDSITSIGDWAFYGTGLTNLIIPDSVVTIGQNAFSYCQNLTSIVIGTNVTDLPSGVFVGCSGLTNVTIPNSVTNIGDWAFGLCYALPSVIIPNSVTIIGNGAFNDCGNLTNITIGSNVASIGSNAFVQCANLLNVTFPASVTNIGHNAFGVCPNLVSFCFLGNAPNADSTVFSGAGFFGYGYTAVVYYLPNTTGWYSPFGGVPAFLWNASIQTANSSFGIQNNQFGFNITGTTNMIILVEACTNLANPTWTLLLIGPLTGGSIYFSDSQWTNYPSRYYRISPE